MYFCALGCFIVALTNNSVSDNTLVLQAKSGNTESLTQLIERYSETIKQKAFSFNNLNGIENEDLFQEGMIGFVSAVYSFDESKNVQFSTYASTLAVRKMISAVRKSNNKSNLPMKYFISLEDENDLLPSFPSPEETLISNEEFDLINSFIENNLSKSEKKVLKLHLLGLAYSEIAEILERDEKFVDNALQRIRRKLRKLR